MFTRFYETWNISTRVDNTILYTQMSYLDMTADFIAAGTMLLLFAVACHDSRVDATYGLLQPTALLNCRDPKFH